MPYVTSTRSGGPQGPASVRDAEKADDKTAQTTSSKLNIEHIHVDDDPRKWSNMRKVRTTLIEIGIYSNLASRRAYWP